jgi:hypothetical protein
MAWTAVVGLYMLPSVWAQSTGPEPVALTLAEPGAVKTGTFTNELDSTVLVVTAPAGSTLDFVVELDPGSTSTSITDDGAEVVYSDSSPARDVWSFARIEVAAGDSTPVAVSCPYSHTSSLADNPLIDGSGGVQLASIVETTWTFTVAYARPPAYSLYNGACNGKCTDATFELADLYSPDDPPRTCPQIIDSYEPVGNEPATHPCTDALGTQPWRITVAATPAMVVQALDAPDSTGDGAALQWQPDAPLTSKDWFYVSSDLENWPRATDESESLTASFAFATDDAGMMVMVDYGRPPTTTRKIGHYQPMGQVGYFFSTAHYDGFGPSAPADCGANMQNCQTGTNGEPTIPIHLWFRDSDRQNYDSRCELPTGAFASEYAGAPSVGDKSKVFIAMRMVESSRFPATPIIKMEYGTYCSTSSGDLCTYHWVSMVLQLVAVVVRQLACVVVLACAASWRPFLLQVL